MATSTERVHKALCHKQPDRTPLFEIFQPYHPIHWDICGRNVATDMSMAWDAMAEGIAWEELLQAHIRAEYDITKYFGLDMVRLNGPPARDYVRPKRRGPGRWELKGVGYQVNPRTKLVEPDDPGQQLSDSQRVNEERLRLQIEQWDGHTSGVTDELDLFIAGVQALARRDDRDMVFMAEIGAGTDVASWPPSMLPWLVQEPQLIEGWLAMHKARGFAATRRAILNGCSVVAMGGDVSYDKGPFLSPRLYRRFILPVIQEHTRLIQGLGAKAVYTSDGNHWPIKQEFFFDTAIDGYKEVDKGAGMTWPRLIDEGVADRICIIGNLDARHTLCLGTPEQVRHEVFEILDFGRSTKGGHILHASHSVHEDVKIENYRAAVAAYREYFALPPLV